MKVIQKLTNTPSETMELGSKISACLKSGDVILLHGDLGAGKTTFVKGLAQGFNIKETVKSPTFNIVKCYFTGTIPFFHIDAYRLEDAKYDIGLDEYIEGNGICAIEWAKYISYLLPSNCIEITINGEGDLPRSVEIKGNEEQISRISKEVM